MQPCSKDLWAAVTREWAQLPDEQREDFGGLAQMGEDLRWTTWKQHGDNAGRQDAAAVVPTSPDVCARSVDLFTIIGGDADDSAAHRAHPLPSVAYSA